MRRIKHAINPDGTMNPGKILARRRSGYTVTLGLLPVSRANGLPLRVSSVVDPPGPFNVIVTLWMFQLSSVSGNELCDVRVNVTLPNADGGWAGPAIVNVFT